MSASNVQAPAAGRPKKIKVLTDLEKRIEALKKLKRDNKATSDQLVELEAKKSQQATLDLRRLASARVQKVMDAMRQIGNLSRLKPTEKQTGQVFGAIKDAVEEALVKWQGNASKEKEEFSLSE